MPCVKIVDLPRFKWRGLAYRNKEISEIDASRGLARRNLLPEGVLRGFAVCGDERVFKWADAAINGDKVVFSCPDVKNIVAVRYAWANFPLCNLYNKEGFPAAPFRTDNLPVNPRLCRGD